MKLHFGIVWEPRAAKIEERKRSKTGTEKRRPQDRPVAIRTLPAEPKEGGKGGGEPPPLGFGGSEDQKIIRKEGKKRRTEQRTTGSTRRPGGSAD